MKSRFLFLFLMIVCLSWSALGVNPQVILETNYGDIVIELFDDDTHDTVTNFLDYMNSGFYDGLTFHRVIEGFMIQGGGYDSELLSRERDEPILNQSDNGRKNVRGTVAMARTSDPHSATSEFFINQVANPFLDPENEASGYGYCVFGRVIISMDVVDIIAAKVVDWKLSPDLVWMENVPRKTVMIRKAEAYDAQKRKYVATDGSDTTGDGTFDLPYATINKAISMVSDYGHVVLKPGTYTGAGNRDIDFAGKAITVRGISPADEVTVAATIIDSQGSVPDQHRAFYFHSGEGVDSVVEGLTITGGYIDYGGGIYCSGAGPTIRNCVITANTAVSSGGGIHSEGSFAPVITDCTLSGNSAGDDGGGIYSIGSNLRVRRCWISNNSSTDGGGAYCTTNKPSFTNCMFIDNTVTGNGGGIFCFQGSPILINCTIVENIISGDGTGGGIYNDIYNEDGSPKVINSILWDNVGSDTVYGSCDITYSDVQGGWAGLGNLNIDPLFIDAPNDDYHLKSYGWSWYAPGATWNDGSRDYEQPWLWDSVTSRCIDSGNPGSNFGEEIKDTFYEEFAGKRGHNVRINMGFYGGMYEASMAPIGWPLWADIDNDGIVNYADLELFGSVWMATLDEPIADFDQSGQVDVADYAVLAYKWLDTASWY